jgi:hypothetical protein
MKKFIVLFVAVLALLALPVHASETKYDSIRVAPTGDDTYGYSLEYPDGTRVWSITKAGVVSGSFTRSIPLPLMNFVIPQGVVAATAATTASPIESDTVPGLAMANSVPYIAWADANTTPVIATFRIPDNYGSGGAFKIYATESDSTTPNQIDFDVFVNKHGTATDSSATGQTPVALTQATTTPSLVTLTPATDFAALVAGDWITLRVWRDDTATGTGTLRIHSVEFVYTASQ